MYKDKEKQKEAVRLATRRYRDKGITKVSHKQGITKCSSVIPDGSTTMEVVQAPHKLISSMPLVMPDEAKPTKAGMGIMNEALKRIKPKPQSYNPMMVGYVPKRGGLV